MEKLYENSGQIDKKSDNSVVGTDYHGLFSSFAHGSNDGNAVAPLATIYHIYQNDSISKKDVPIWVLVQVVSVL